MNSVRKLENFHILLWLFKDTSWLMGWKAFGIFMIFPTLSFAIYITYKIRDVSSEFYHNLAIIFWISANSFWMLTEFAGKEETLKHYAIIPFSIGFIIIGIYYLKHFLKRLRRDF